MHNTACGPMRPVESQLATFHPKCVNFCTKMAYNELIISCWSSAYLSLKWDINANVYGRISKMSSASGGFAPDPHWDHSPQTHAVAVHFGSKFVCSPSLQIRCAPLTLARFRSACNKHNCLQWEWIVGSFTLQSFMLSLDH